MVIFSHMRSLTSKPDSGDAMALATDAISECRDKLKSSKPAGSRKVTKREREKKKWLDLSRNASGVPFLEIKGRKAEGLAYHVAQQQQQKQGCRWEMQTLG